MYISNTNNSSHFFFNLKSQEFNETIEMSEDEVIFRTEESSIKFDIKFVDSVEFLNEFGDPTNITDIQRLIQVNEEVKIHARQYNRTNYESFKINSELTIEVKDVLSK